jgi:AcrR family transcriptional regulator
VLVAVAHRPLRADARRNREAIVLAARRLVAEHGNDAQIDGIAREAGVGVGTVYRHFSTKSALVAELLRECMLENAQIARDADQRSDPWDAFAEMVRTYCQSMSGDVTTRQIWKAAPPKGAAHAGRAQAEMMATIAVVVDRARAASVLRPDFSIEDMQGLMCGMAAIIDQPGAGDWKRLVEFMLDGISARAGVVIGAGRGISSCGSSLSGTAR